MSLTESLTTREAILLDDFGVTIMEQLMGMAQGPVKGKRGNRSMLALA